jgi:hypothetical protein
MQIHVHLIYRLEACGNFILLDKADSLKKALSMAKNINKFGCFEFTAKPNNVYKLFRLGPPAIYIYDMAFKTMKPLSDYL